MLRLSAPPKRWTTTTAPLRPSYAVTARAAPEEPEHRADGHAADRAAQVMIPRQQVPQPMRQAKHPLTDWHVGKDVVDEMCRAFRHAAAAAPRTEPAALTREGDESIQRAGGAPKASEAASQTAALEEVAKLLFHKAREAFAVTQRRGLGTERLEMVSDDPVSRRRRSTCRKTVGAGRTTATTRGPAQTGRR